MWQFRLIRWFTNSCLSLAIAAGTLPARAQAGQASALSRWLSRDVVPELRQLLSHHPRYEGQRVQLAAGTRDGLTEAVVALLQSNLAGREGVSLVARGFSDPLRLPISGNIDELDCQATPRFDYLLQTSVTGGEGGHGQVQLELLELNSAALQTHSWQWRGRFSAAERRQFNKHPATASPDGSLNAPWSGGDVDAAALSLSREFACALRPAIRTRLTLYWPQYETLPALFADTANATRHLLGNFAQLGMTTDAPNYRVEVRIEPFRDDTWQFWLTGTPTRNDLAPVQAVTYFKVSDLGWQKPALALAASAQPKPAIPVDHSQAGHDPVGPRSVGPRSVGPRSVGPLQVKRGRPELSPAERGPALPPAIERGPALEFIDVEVLDATQSDRGLARADLEVTLRIANRADWPIEYSFKLSGGHFNHCIAQPDYYRHDRYGVLDGSVDAGASVVRRLIIRNAQHRPAPLFGMRKCAGFRNLEGFEDYAGQGYKVTDFVRWDL